MAVVPQFAGRQAQKRPHEVDPRSELASRTHAADAGRSGPAKERQQYRFALVFCVVRGGDGGAPSPSRQGDQRRVARLPQGRLVPRLRCEPDDVEREPEPGGDTGRHALVLPGRRTGAVVDVGEPQVELHPLGDRVQRRRQRDRVRSAAAGDQHAVAAPHDTA